MRQALRGSVAVPREYHDQPLASAIASASPALSDQARRDLSEAALELLAALRSGRHTHANASRLLRLVTELDLRAGAVPILRELAAEIPDIHERISWQSCSDVLLALLNLRDLQDIAFWRRMWEHNKRTFSAVTLNALFDLDPDAALEFLPELPNSEEIGDVTVLNLDYCADTFQGAERARFREAAANVSSRCAKKIRTAIITWLEETRQPASGTADLTRLYMALPVTPEKWEPSPAKLCELQEVA